jgi:small subunit ribosomal protein S20
MPNTKQAAKALRQNIIKTSRNIKIREDIQTLLKKIRKAVTAKQDQAKIAEMLKNVQKAIDKAVQKGVFKKNTGSRKISRIIRYSQQANKGASKKAE